MSTVGPENDITRNPQTQLSPSCTSVNSCHHCNWSLHSRQKWYLPTFLKIWGNRQNISHRPTY